MVTRLTRRSRFLFEWSAAYCLGRPEQSLDAVTGHVATFTRAGTGTFLDAAGRLGMAAHSQPRFQWTLNSATGLYEPGILLEGARANNVPYSSEAGAGGDNWVADSNITVAQNAVGPDGVANSAVTVTATDVQHYVGPLALVSVSASTLHVLSRYIKKGNTRWVWVGDSQDAVWHRASFDLDTGVVGTSASCVGRIVETLGNGWYRVEIAFTSTNAYTPAVVSGTATSTSSFSGTIGDTHLCYGAQFEKLALFSSSYIKTTTVAVSRAADALSFPWNAPPQAMTVYADLTFAGVVDATTNYHTLMMSNAAGATPYFKVRVEGSNPTATEVVHQTSAGIVVADIGVAVSGSRLEQRGVLASDGSVTSGASINGATEVVGTPSATLALPTAWSGQLLTIGDSPLSGQPSYSILRTLRIAAGVRSLDFMRAG